MEVPYYTTTIYPGARLVLDDKGVPVYQGMTSATFTVRSGDPQCSYPRCCFAVGAYSTQRSQWDI